MQFSIINLPLLGTHFLCLLVGFSLCALNAKPEKRTWPSYVLIPLAKNTKLLEGVVGEDIRIFAQNITSKEAPCALITQKMTLMQKDPFLVIAAKVDDAALILKMMKQRRMLSIIPLSSQKIPSNIDCQTKERISYGAVKDFL